MIVEALMSIAILGFMAALEIVGNSTLIPTWPTWLVGTGTGTVSGSFVWLRETLAPASAWINAPLMFAVAVFVILFQGGLLVLQLLFKVLFAVKKAVPFG